MTGRKTLLLLLVTAILIGAGIVALKLLSPRTDKQLAVEEYNSARKVAAEYLGEVNDWPAWYRSRIKGTEACDAFRSWYAKAAKLEDRLHVNPADIDMNVGNDLRGEKSFGSLPSREQAREFMQLTGPFSAELEPLLQYDALTGIPEFENELPQGSPLPLLTAMRIVTGRALILAWFGDMDEAWRECLRVIRLAKRLQHASTMFEYMIVTAAQRLAFQAFSTLCATGCPPPEFDQFIPIPLPPDNTIDVFEKELAYIVQSPEIDDAVWDYTDEAADAIAPLFGPTDEAGLVAAFRADARDVQLKVKYLRALKDGSPAPTPEETHKHLWAIPSNSRAKLGREVLHANLAMQLRHAERDGQPIAVYVADPATYARMEVNPTADGWLEIYWQPTDRVKDKFKSPFADTAQGLVPEEPLRIRPAR